MNAVLRGARAVAIGALVIVLIDFGNRRTLAWALTLGGAAWFVAAGIARRAQRRHRAQQHRAAVRTGAVVDLQAWQRSTRGRVPSRWTA